MFDSDVCLSLSAHGSRTNRQFPTTDDVNLPCHVPCPLGGRAGKQLVALVRGALVEAVEARPCCPFGIGMSSVFPRRHIGYAKSEHQHLAWLACAASAMLLGVPQPTTAAPWPVVISGTTPEQGGDSFVTFKEWRSRRNGNSPDQTMEIDEARTKVPPKVCYLSFCNLACIAQQVDQIG